MKRYILPIFLLITFSLWDSKEQKQARINRPLTKKFNKNNAIPKEKKSVSRSIASVAKQTFISKVKDELQLDEDAVVNIIKKSSDPKTGLVHSIVTIRKKQIRSSFEALIDQKTGRIIKSWNNSKYEGAKGLRIPAKGTEYYSY